MYSAGLRLADEDTTDEPVESIEEIRRRLDLTRDDLRPLLDGTARDYQAFPNYATHFRRFRLLWKLGLTGESLYWKYANGR